MNRHISRKEKIHMIENIKEFGFNSMLFTKPKTFVFVQLTNDENMFKMENKIYTKNEVIEFENKINNINIYLNDKQMFKNLKLHKVVVIVFKRLNND